MPTPDTLRYSPSGPPLSDYPNVFGGVRLRMAQAGGSVSTLALTEDFLVLQPADPNASFVVGLDNPIASRGYAVNAHVAANKNVSVETGVTLQLQVRYQVGGVFGPWEELRTNTRVSPAGAPQVAQVAIDQPMSIGSALLRPVPPNCERIEVQCAARATTEASWTVENGGQAGTFWLSLEELVPPAP